MIANIYSAAIEKIFAAGRLNRLEEAAAQRPEGSEARFLLESLGVMCNVREADLANIPREGAAIVVCNHPTGLLDGVMLIDLLPRLRPDVKFMGNFLLNRIEFFRRYFIAVDPFDSKDRGKNMRGLRESMEHLRNGGMLALFPAGAVATWTKGFGRARDFPWSRSIVRFIHNARCPVVPMYIEGRNSRMFHLLGKIHPMLRTAMLPREMLNKRGAITISIGSPLSVKRASELDGAEQFGRYIRANSEYLAAPRPKRRRKKRRAEPCGEARRIIDPVPRKLLMAEMESIAAEHLLFDSGDYRVFFSPPALIPNMLTEIGRMREVTFRSIGEGSMKEIDTDTYDAYYHQLFIWDGAAEALVGAYRMGMGAEIVPTRGLDGFYTNTLFRMERQMLPIMERTIELGRSFVTRDYQRRAVSLMLLWKGILYILLKHREYRNLMGPVTISGEMSDVSKMLIVRYLLRWHMDEKLARHIRSVTGLDGVSSEADYSLVEDIDNVELINKLVADIEREEFSIPVLIRKYLSLNSHVLAFNVDHDFSDCLDALMLLDLKRIPRNTIELLSKEIADIDVLARFRDVH
jgi:putative hemolysin